MAELRNQDLLSNRARDNVEGDDHWAPLVNALASPYSPTNTDGIAHFTYGNGPQGSPRLRKAISNFFNSRFAPLKPTQPDEFIITAGVTAMIDHLTWSICNEGEGILLPQPLYTGFTNDIPTRSKGKLVPVSFAREDGSVVLDDVFDPEANLRCFERAYAESQRNGAKIKGVMITNPHNPLGKCYSKEAIVAIMRFCAKYGLHYLSDEIYAMSVFKNERYPDATPFQSVLSIDTEGIINPELVHVLYGAAKDFCANGLRLGAFHTRNEVLRKAVLSITTFSWEAYIVQDMWARILEDTPFLDRFIGDNQKQLASHYALLTNFLDDNHIPYFQGGNAALFLWVDLRRWLLGNSDADTAVLRSTSPDAAKYKAKEDRLSKRWLEKGVMIAKGSRSLSEEIGWFRIVFTAEEKALRTGLNRFLEGLREW
ncbi:uncharacterized protein LTR77_007964 [Saxophila tyrrhenica]|uniref:Aminotransferase class I/classII large domain-containing protein n=1 Tax=Saxophila tyrrhenica TaxID=1690608 RepID=A0AAV9P496_9PEZI|nr:hypothetical protein LTR77_007964 [Saxophila tyrrhenica]